MLYLVVTHTRIPPPPSAGGAARSHIAGDGSADVKDDKHSVTEASVKENHWILDIHCGIGAGPSLQFGVRRIKKKTFRSCTRAGRYALWSPAWGPLCPRSLETSYRAPKVERGGQTWRCAETVYARHWSPAHGPRCPWTNLGSKRWQSGASAPLYARHWSPKRAERRGSTIARSLWLLQVSHGTLRACVYA